MWAHVRMCSTYGNFFSLLRRGPIVFIRFQKDSWLPIFKNYCPRLLSKSVKGSDKLQVPASFPNQIIISSCAKAHQPSQLVFPTSQLIPNDHRHNQDRTWQVAKVRSRMERSRFFPKAVREGFAERWQNGLVINEADISPRMSLQKRQHLPNPFFNRMQPLTDAEEISRMGFLGSALNLPWDIGSHTKSSQVIKSWISIRWLWFVHLK